ncbi:MAG: DUF4249 family protein [Ginsengibacter sp.]
MERNKGLVFLIVVSAIFLVSCEKVIDINLNAANPKYVIEGNLSDIPGDCEVMVSQTVNFSDPSIFSGIENAVVSIREDEKEPIVLSQSRPGVYVSGNLRAKPTHNYTLSVTVNGQQFTSTVRAPIKVAFDSLSVFNFSGFGNSRKFANVEFRDIEGLGNAYRFVQYKNDLRNPNTYVLNDDYSDGRSINTFLAFFDNSDGQRLDTGDTLTVDMQCIDPSVYKFFLSLSQSSTGGNSDVAPGNPVSNIRGGALGYFNAFMKQRKRIIVP